LLVYNLAVKIAEDNNIVLPQSVVSYAEYTKMLVSRMFEINKPPSEVDFDIPSVCSGTLNITTGV
jgi:translation initiation factor 2 gamma subunit (eIF-2gamma)